MPDNYFSNFLNNYSISLLFLANQFAAWLMSKQKIQTVDFMFYSNKNTRYNVMYFYLTYINIYTYIST